ncbi:MAG TPA: pitrilysin family protein, partial [Gemmatimonadaceae bacterium]|nr:pitrilysin family protein [Gemmatimonadaceae bacterium]
EGLAVQSDAYANSVIDAGELARELEVIIQEVRRKTDNPPALATESLYALLFDQHRIRRWRIGDPDRLRTFTREDVRGFYRTYYYPGNTILSIVGDVDPEATLALVEAYYGALPDRPIVRDRGPAEHSVAGLRYREWSGDIAQAQLLFGWRTGGTLDPDTPLLDIAAAALGGGRASRLYRAVRERQLASSITAYNYTPTELGVFVIQAETPQGKTLDAARAVWAEVQPDFTSSEIERAQRLFESQWARRTESMEGQANHLAEWEALGDWQLGEQYLSRVLLATAADVTAAFRRHVKQPETAALVYRPNDSPEIGGLKVGGLEVGGLFGALESGLPKPVSAPSRQGNIVAPPQAAATFEEEIAGVRVYRTAGGVPILVRRKPGAAMTHLGVYAFGGARNEAPERAGETTLMARTATKGTTTRTAAEIASRAEFLGGTVSASVGSENFGWSLSVPTRGTEAALALVADVVQRPTFPESALETERSLMLADLTALRDDMYRYPVRLATSAAFAGHPYGVGTLGTEESIRSVTVDAVLRWHQEHVLAGPTLIGIVGDVDPDEIAAVAAGELAALHASARFSIAPPIWPNQPRREVESRDKAQTAMALAFPGPTRNDPDRFTAHLIATMASGLGGRFFDELRDKRSLAYTVHAVATERLLAGMFIAYIATSPSQEQEARAGLLAEFEKLRSAPVSAEELSRAQTYTIGAHAIRQQSGASVLADVIDAWQFGRGLDELDDFETRVLAVTPAEIQALAQRYFDVARVVEGIVRGVSGA